VHATVGTITLQIQPRAAGAGGLVAGHANKVIAYDLGISSRTVEIYRANEMTKMNASSLSELVRMALIAGLLQWEPER
jgi:FixJ family two-component response regulator